MKAKAEKPMRNIGKSLQNINDRIEFIRISLGYPVTTFSKKLGISKSGLINVLSPTKNSDPSFKMLQSVCRIFPVSNEWLLLGHGEPFTMDDISEYKHKENGKDKATDPELNRRMKEIRIDTGLSQAMFADDVKTTRDVITFVENNRQTMTIPLLKRIVERYNINPMWLLFGSGNKYLLKSETRSVKSPKGKGK